MGMVLRPDKRESPSAGPPPRARHGAGHARRALDALARVSQMIAGDLDLGSLQRSAIGAAAEAMNAEACSIMLQDADGRALRFQVVDGPQTGDLATAAVPIDDHSIAGWVAKHQAPALVPDAYDDPRFTAAYDTRTGFRTRSVICVPLVAKGRPLGVIQLLNRRDGRSFDAEDLELAEAVASLIAVAIHNAEEHEARLRAERLATIGQTIAGMAHCVKNILNGLRAGSYIVDQHLDDEAEPRVMRGWQIVRRNMNLLSNIVLDMLSYSKDRKPLRRPCQVGALCEDVANLLREQAAAKGVTISTTSALETEVSVDEAGLSRCLINLVGNAIDACAEGGRVEMIAEADADPARFAIRVRDNGCGLSAEAREKIFDPFFSTKGGKGTGLGLAVTRKIVAEHGGCVRVESEVGRGTEFTLVLPRAPVPGPS